MEPISSGLVAGMKAVEAAGLVTKYSDSAVKELRKIGYGKVKISIHIIIDFYSKLTIDDFESKLAEARSYEEFKRNNHNEFTLIHSGWDSDKKSRFGQPYSDVRSIMDDGWERIVKEKLPEYVSK